LVAALNRAMAEQVTGTNQISASTDLLRLQSEQTARGLQDQAGAMKTLSDSTAVIVRQIKAITEANRLHSETAEFVLHSVAEVRGLVPAGAPLPQKAGRRAATRKRIQKKVTDSANANGTNGSNP